MKDCDEVLGVLADGCESGESAMSGLVTGETRALDLALQVWRWLFLISHGIMG